MIFKNHIVKNGYQPIAITSETLINGLCKIDVIDSAFWILMLDGTRLKLMWCTIAQSSTDFIRITEAFDLFSEMMSKDIQPNHVTYTCLMDGLCNVGKWEEAQSLTEKMTQENLLPNVQTCSIMHHVGLYVQRREVGRCKNTFWWDDSKRHWAKHNHLQYFDWWIHFPQKMEDADESFNIMVKRGCLLDLYSYTIMINAYCKRQRIGERMSKKGIFLDIVTFNALINGLFLLMKPQDALKMYQIMWDCSHHPNRVTYAILLEGLFKNHLFDEGMKLFLEIKDIFGKQYHDLYHLA